MNAHRINAANAALHAHAEIKGDDEESLIDLLTDLIHLARWKRIPWDASVDMAEEHFRHEIKDLA